MRITPRFKQFSAIAQVEIITCVADVSDSLDGTFFQLSDSAGTVGVWIDVDNSGTTIPAGASALDRVGGIEVTGVVTDDTAAAVATAVASAINADSEYTATAVGDTVIVVQATGGDVGDFVDGDTGFTGTVHTNGSNVHPEFTGIRGIISLAVTGADAEINGETLASGSTWGEMMCADADLMHLTVTTAGASVVSLWYWASDPI